MARRNATSRSAPARTTQRKKQPETSLIANSNSSSGLSGLFSHFATTAAGVAVGNAIGRAIAGVFSSSGNSAAAEQPFQAERQQDLATNKCDGDSKALMECMRRNGDDISMCQAYFDMLKQCQGASGY